MNNIILLNPSASENGSAAPSDRLTSDNFREPNAQELIRAANAAFHEGRLPEAREALRAALACQPDDSELILALGHVEFGLAQFDLALRRYHLAAEMNPLRAEAHSSQALTLKLLGQSREADAAARRALGIDANDMVALKVLAKIRLEDGHHHQARQFCRRILDRNPSDAEGLDFLDQCRFDLEESTAELPELPCISPASWGLENEPTADGYPLCHNTYASGELTLRYNSETCLKACLEDLERQTIADQLEIIVIDSGSEQNEKVVVEAFQKRYDNIRYLRTERETLYAAWNRGLELANGEFITNANASRS